MGSKNTKEEVDTATALVVYATLHDHYILLHSYKINDNIKRCNLGNGVWGAGELGYIKGPVALLKPVERYVESVIDIKDKDPDYFALILYRLREEILLVDELKILTYGKLTLSNDKKISDIFITKHLNVNTTDPGITRLLTLKEYAKYHKDTIDDKLYKYDVKGFFTNKLDRHPLLLGSKSIIFNKVLREFSDKLFYSVNSNDTDTFGRKVPTLSYVVTKLNNNNSIIDDIVDIRKQFKGYEKAICNIYMDELYNPRNIALLSQFGDRGIVKAQDNPVVLTNIIGKPIIADIYPPNLVNKMLSDFNGLYKYLELFTSVNGEETYTVKGVLFKDITSSFYVDGVLDKTLNKNPKMVISVDLGNDKRINVPICLGEDLPNRNSLVKLTKLKPRIFICINIRPNRYIYKIVIDSAEGTSIWSNFFASTIFSLD